MKKFECNEWNNRKLELAENRIVTTATLLDKDNNPIDHKFLLDTGAIISVLKRITAENDYRIYNDNVITYKARMGGFNKQPMEGRTIQVKQLTLGKRAVNDVHFFVPNDYLDIVEVLGAEILNSIVPVPDFEKEIVWFIKNTKNLPEYYSKNLGVTLKSNLLTQDDTFDKNSFTK